MEVEQSGSQNKTLKGSGIDFEKLGLCTVDHCADLAVVEERFGPDCGRLMYTIGGKLAGYTEMPCPPEYNLQSIKKKVSNHIMTDLRNLNGTRPE